MFDQLKTFYRLLKQTLRLMIGIPDYQVYLEHSKTHHPELRPMNEEEFFRNSQARRYDSSKAGRCC
ncbi:MAG: putative selenoprotein [Proteobacteria bacterium]|nr:MAG: putative selenoprotein [Pseudomonadota bacterium]